MAKVLEYQPKQGAVPGKPAEYQLVPHTQSGRRTFANADEALSVMLAAKPAEYCLLKTRDEIPGTEAVPGKVVLELTMDEALFLRRLVGHHCVSGNESSSIFGALITVPGLYKASALPAGTVFAI